jgi:hypothetical protein
MFKLIKTLQEIYKEEHSHFLFVEYDIYKKWKFLIRFAVKINKNYVSCEIFRKKYKIHTDFVVIGLRWSGKNVKRRTNGYAKEFLTQNEGSTCIYCDTPLTEENATSDHIIPISQGGNNTQVNMIICCKDCNNERGNLPFESYLKIKNTKFKSLKHPFI